MGMEIFEGAPAWLASRRYVPEQLRQHEEHQAAIKRMRAVTPLLSTTSGPPSALPAPSPSPSPSLPPLLTGGRLDPQFSFARFCVGEENRVAFCAAQKVGERAAWETLTFAPLFLHASVGLGKTHLLQAIAGAARARGFRMAHFAADRFIYALQTAVKADEKDLFRSGLDNVELLILDDLQFLNSKPARALLLQALPGLLDAGRQVVLAADRPPGDLDWLDAGARSRIASGLCVAMTAPEQELRGRMFDQMLEDAKLRNPGMRVTEDVRNFVVSQVCGGPRDLIGAVNILSVMQPAGDPPVSLQAAGFALWDLVKPRETRRIKIGAIQRLVSAHYLVSVEDILSSRRPAEVVRPRQMAMYLAKQMTLCSLPEIGRRFGGRDHTTILHAIRKIGGLVERDEKLRDEVEMFKRVLQA